MKNKLKLFFLTVILMVFACDKTKNTDTSSVSASKLSSTSISKYDSIKAQAYGADDYGMKKYVIAFLKRGPNKSVDSVKRAELQLAHMNNINRLAEEGKLVLAGPFFGNDDLRGIYVFNVESIDEAEALTNTDPSIKAGVLVMELKEWYGSAALMEVNGLHHTLAKKDF